MTMAFGAGHAAADGVALRSPGVSLVTAGAPGSSAMVPVHPAASTSSDTQREKDDRLMLLPHPA